MDRRIFNQNHLMVIGTSEGWRVWDFCRQLPMSPWFDSVEQAQDAMKNMSKVVVINDFEE